MFRPSLNLGTLVPVAFLDRDGVINRKLPGGRFVSGWAEFEFLPGVEQAIRLLNENDRRVILVTNQRGVSLGLYSENDLKHLHKQMTAALEKEGAFLDGIYYCPHSIGTCACRKPGIALFQQAFRDFAGTNPSASVVVGDSLSDMRAAQTLGSKKILIGDMRGTLRTKAEATGIQIDFFANSLLDAVQQYILVGNGEFRSRADV
jgi:D-glycero-D-manno-heptose 1,7-bisphosphate phosphatase